MRSFSKALALSAALSAGCAHLEADTPAEKPDPYASHNTDQIKFDYSEKERAVDYAQFVEGGIYECRELAAELLRFESSYVSGDVVFSCHPKPTRIRHSDDLGPSVNIYFDRARNMVNEVWR